MTRPLRIVLDTSVLVAALRSPTGASSVILDLLEQQELTLMVTTALLLEYESVLLRDEQRAHHGLSPENIDVLLNRLTTRAEKIRVRHRYRPQLSDPNDEHVLEAAVNGFADALVTHNISDFLPAALFFGIPVLRPADMIQMRRLQ